MFVLNCKNCTLLHNKNNDINHKIENKIEIFNSKVSLPYFKCGGNSKIFNRKRSREKLIMNNKNMEKFGCCLLCRESHLNECNCENCFNLNSKMMNNSKLNCQSDKSLNIFSTLSSSSISLSSSSSLAESSLRTQSSQNLKHRRRKSISEVTNDNNNSVNVKCIVNNINNNNNNNNLNKSINNQHKYNESNIKNKNKRTFNYFKFSQAFSSLLQIFILINIFLNCNVMAAYNELQYKGDINLTKSGVCQSVDIRNEPKNLEKLNGCRVVEGFVQILLMEKFSNESYFQNYTFPLLTEITDYFLMFRVNGIRSLAHLFPNLMVIRGKHLLSNYAFILYELTDLQEIGLQSLTYIGRGAVRIEKNPSLCYVNTIDWTLIAKHTTKDENVFSKNKKVNECPSCGPKNKEEGAPDMKQCWSRYVPQKICPSNCPNSCNDANECCHEDCIGSCVIDQPNNCTVCRHFRIELNDTEVCSRHCPNGTYEHMSRRCLTKEECYETPLPLDIKDNRGIVYIPFEGKCSINCPPGYYESNVSGVNRTCKPCSGSSCKKTCEGANIDSIQSAQQLRGCTHINGPLEIQIRSQGGMSIVKELEQSLSSIVEIDGYLKVIRSFPLLSLNFLKNLKRIRGEKLENKKYALILLDNQNLQDLWDDNHTLIIEKGKLFFHFNPKLCYYKIERLKSMITDEVEFIDEDVARTSNGDKIACNVTVLNVSVSFTTASAAVIKWEPLPFEDDRNLLGYIVYYIAAPYANVSLYDGRDACGGDGWNVDDLTERTTDKFITHIITHLEPFTQYAYYVKTYTVSSETTGAQSPVQYFRTEAGQPENVQKLKAVANASTEIHLSWDPPKKVNGLLESFIIKAKLINDNPDILEQRNYCDEPLTTEYLTEKPKISEKSHEKDCDCSNPYTGPMPGHKKFAQTDDIENEIDFEDQLHNWVYIKKPQSHNRRRREVLTLEDKATTVNNKDFVLQEFPYPNQTDNSQNIDETKSILDPRSAYYLYYYVEVNSTVRSYTLTKLRHFSLYSISVSACRSINVGRVDIYPACGNEVILHSNTKKVEAYDEVTNLQVVTDLGNQSSSSARLSWNPPEHPNGFVLTYTIRYQRLDLENSKSNIICIPHRLFLNLSRTYVLQNLETGNYSVDIMATTLAGNGKYCKKAYFYIESNSRGYLIGLICGILILIIIGGVVFCYCRRRYMPVNNLKLIASVNPEYVSMQYTPDEWEVPRENITKIRELGQGSFGMVYEGTIKNLKKNNEEMPCAIKTVNESATDRERINFLKEASVMKAFDTNHVVRLLGVVSCGQPTLVIMELMANGDLKGYLRSHRPDSESVKAGQPPPQPPTLKRILQMAIEIADGMAYLSAKKFVHRDLAARNCMVADDLTVKIGDFGMTRDIYETDYYRKGTKGLLPVRWMAPESLKDGVFTSHSDVFSYGVVLWEMATLASQPYQGLSNDQVLRYVIDGGVMERPENCPNILYELMRRCWQHRPSARPSFIDIVSMLLDDANPTFRSVSFYHSNEGQELVTQMLNNAKAMDDATTPLRHEEALSVDVDPDDNYSFDGNNSLLVQEEDGTLPTIRSRTAPSPLSGGIGSGIHIENNYIISSYQSGQNDGPLHSQGSKINSITSNLTLSTSELSDRLPDSLKLQSSTRRDSGFGILRNAIMGSGSGSSIVGIGGNRLSNPFNNSNEYQKLHSQYKKPPLGNGFVMQQYQSQHQQQTQPN